MKSPEVHSYVPLFNISALVAQTSQSASVPDPLKAAFAARKHLLTPRGIPRRSSKPLPAEVTLKDGSTASKASEAERKLVGEAADRLDLDATEALVLLRSYAVLQRGMAAWQEDADLEPDPEWWTSLETFYFDERVTAIKLLVTILEASDDPFISPALQEYMSELLAELLPQTITKDLVEAFLELSSRAVPTTAASSNAAATLWAKQYVREQHELLELLFCYWYKLPAQGTDVKLLLDAIDRSEWGAKQACAAYWDAEARMHAKNVSYTLVALSIVSLSLETISNPAEPFELALATQKLPPTDSLLHPNLLLATHTQVINLAAAFPAATAPFAACWSYALSRLTLSLDRGEIAQEYNEFIDAVSPTREHNQPVWQRLLTHALPFLFPCLTAALPTASISTASSLGVLTCLRAPFALLPSMIQLSFLPEDQCTSMTDFACALYGHPEAALLRAHYWSAQEPMASDSTLSEGEQELLDLHARRFPFRPAPLLRLLKALAGGSDLSDTVAAAGACAYLRRLPYLTSHVVKGSAMGGLPYEISSRDQTVYRVVKPSPGFRISASVYVPQYTQGLLVSSGNGKEGVVQWDLAEHPWDGWLFLSDLLAAYAQKSQHASKVVSMSLVRSSMADPFVAREDAVSSVLQFDGQEQEEAVADALDLFAREVIVSKVSSKEADGKSQLVFEVLEKAIVAGSRQVAASSLRALTGLLSLQPGVIWSLLRSGKGDLFTVAPISRGLRGGAALLQLDRRIGSYESLIALLELVNALTLETQRAAATAEHLQVKADVLKNAYRWIMDQVWSADFGSWRYQEARDRWMLASQVGLLWSNLAYDFTLGTNGNLAGAADMVLDGLLVDATHTAPGITSVSPLISLISLTYDGMVHAIRNGRDLDSLACEKALQISLQLVINLLILRKHRQPTSPSYLEHLLLSQTAVISSADKPVLEPTAAMLACILAHHAVQAQTVVLAARTLAALSVLSFDFRSTSFGPQSLLSTFNDSDRQFGVLMQLAEDMHLPVEMRLAIWDLMTAFVTSQPSLAVLIISGRLGADHTKEKKEKTIVSSAVGLMIQNQAIAMEPRLQEAVMRFLVATWQQSLDYSDLLAPARQDLKFWLAVAQLVTEAIVIEQDDEEATVLHVLTLEAHATMAKAYAVRLISLDLECSRALNVKDPPSLASIEGVFSEAGKLRSTLSSALENSISSSLHQQVFEAIATTFKTFSIECVRKAKALGHPALDVHRPLGSEYVFDVSLLFFKLSALTRRSIDVDNAVYSLEQVDANWSLVDAQLAVTKAWNQLIQASSDALRSSKPDQLAARSMACLEVANGVLDTIASETQSGEVMGTIHSARLYNLVQLLENAASHDKPSATLLVSLFERVTFLTRNETLNPFDSLEGRTSSPFHRPILAVLYLLLTIALKPQGLTVQNLDAKSVASLSRSLEAIIKFLCLSLRNFLTRPTTDADSTYEHDFGTVVSIFRQVLSMPHGPAPSVWLTMCTDSDILRLGLRAIVSSPLSALSKPTASGTVCRHVLSWFLCLSHFSLAAEKLAVENTLGILCSTSVIASATDGEIVAVDSETQERSESHRIWCLSLALVARLASVLGSSSSFMAEVCGFARLTLRQQALLFRWDPNTVLPLPLIEEMEVSVGLFSAISRRAPHNEACHLIRHEALFFLNSLIYAIQHPNTIVASIIATSNEERLWLSQGENEPASAPDHSKRPVAGPMVQSFLSLICSVVDALAVSLEAFQVLQQDETSWPFENIELYPTSKVAVHKPASIGSLIDLCGWCLDLVRTHSATTTTPSQTTFLLPPYDLELMQTVGYVTLEASLLLAVSQMALMFYRPVQAQSASTVAKMRREISSELAQDVLSLLAKAISLKRSGKEQNRVLLALQRFITLRMK